MWPAFGLDLLDSHVILKAMQVSTLFESQKDSKSQGNGTFKSEREQ